MPLALPAAGVVMAALLALMLLYGLNAFIKALAALFRGIPWFGSAAANGVEIVGLSVQAGIQWLMCDIIRPIVNLVMGPLVGFVRLITGLESFARNMASSWVWLLNDAIPQVIAKLTRLAYDYAHTARLYAEALVTSALHTVSAAIVRYYHAAQHYAYGLYRLAVADIVAARTYAAALVSTLSHAVSAAIIRYYTLALHYAEAGDAALGRALHQLAAQVSAIQATTLALIRSEVASGVKAAESYTDAAAGKVISTLETTTVAGLAAAWPTITDELDALAGVIGTDLPDIGAAVAAIPRALPADLTDVIAVTGELALPALRYMRECGVPNCRNLSSLGRELQNLLGDLAGGALLALFAELALHPVDTAHWLQDNVGGLAQDAVNGARDLLASI